MYDPHVTVRTGAPRWWRATTGIAVPGLVAVACGVMLWSSAAPVVDFVYFMLAGWALVLLGVAWLVLVVIGWFRYRTVRRTLLAPAVVAPALVLVTAALVVVQAPFRLGFLVSKPALADAAADCTYSLEHRRIGVYSVRSTRELDGGCLFFTQGGLIDSVGIAYLPGGAPHLGAPRHDGDIGYDHIGGDWYRFVERF